MHQNFFFNQKLSIRDVVLGNVRNVSIRELPFGNVSAGTNVTAPFSASRSFLNLCFSFNKNSSSEIDFQAKEANQSYGNTNQLSPKLNFCRNFRKPVSSRFNSNRFETEKKTFRVEIEKWNCFQQDDATCSAGRGLVL